MRLLVLGGSFNPIHIGHLMLGEEVAAEFGYDRVLLVPSFLPPHKALADDPGPEARLGMARAATAGSGAFLVDACEIEREGLSYTYDTLGHVMGAYPLDGKPGLAHLLHEVALLHTAAAEHVPLVDQHDAGLPCRGDHAGDAAVLGAGRIGGVQHQQHHIGPPDRAFGACHAEEVDHGRHLAAPAQTGGVDEGHRDLLGAVPQHHRNVDGIACRPRDVADDDPFGPEEAVHQG